MQSMTVRTPDKAENSIEVKVNVDRVSFFGNEEHIIWHLLN